MFDFGCKDTQFISITAAIGYQALCPACITKKSETTQMLRFFPPLITINHLLNQIHGVILKFD